MSIPSYRLPAGIERASKFGPTFRNVIQEALSGNEQRFAQWTKCRCVGDLSYGLLTSSDPLGDFAAILALWRGHFGSLYPFRFRDWSDYTTTDELFGNGDGAKKDFQLVKTYDPSQILLGSPGSLFYVRSITLVSSSPAPVIKVNGVIKSTPADYTINSTGVVSFVSAPAAATNLTWTGQFDVPVRFDTDQLPVVLNESDITAIQSIPIKEVIGES